MPVNMNMQPGPEWMASKGEESSLSHQKQQEERMVKRAAEMVDSRHELAGKIQKIISSPERKFAGLNEDEIDELAEAGYERKLIKTIIEEVARRNIQ